MGIMAYVLLWVMQDFISSAVVIQTKTILITIRIIVVMVIDPEEKEITVISDCEIVAKVILLKTTIAISDSSNYVTKKQERNNRVTRVREAIYEYKQEC